VPFGVTTFVVYSLCMLTSGGVIKWPTQMGGNLEAIFLNCMGYFRGPHKWMKFCNIGELGGVIMWPTQIGGIFGAIFGESGGALKWPTQMGDILGAILVHQVG
jgi:hypothetical protein